MTTQGNIRKQTLHFNNSDFSTGGEPINSFDWERVYYSKNKNSKNKAKPIIKKGRPNFDCTTTRTIGLSFSLCPLYQISYHSWVRFSASNYLAEIFYLLSSLQLSLPSGIYALVFAIILVGRQICDFSDITIRFSFDPSQCSHHSLPHLFICLLILTSFFWRLSPNAQWSWIVSSQSEKN